MGIKDKLEQDKAVVADALAKLDAAKLVVDEATAQVAKDEAALAVIAPQLAAWDAVDNYAHTLTDQAVFEILNQLVAAGRATIDV